MSQVGNEVVALGAPKFSAYVVVDGTWKEKDTTEKLRTDDGDSEVYNYSFWRVGMEASCDVVIKAEEVPLAVGDVLAELSPGTRSFVVLEAEQSSFGGMPLKQALTLAYHDGFTPTVIT